MAGRKRPAHHTLMRATTTGNRRWSTSHPPDSPRRRLSAILPEELGQLQAVAWALGKMERLEGQSHGSLFTEWIPAEVVKARKGSLPCQRRKCSRGRTRNAEPSLTVFRWPLPYVSQGWIHRRPSSHSEGSGPPVMRVQTCRTPDVARACQSGPGQACLTPSPRGAAVGPVYLASICSSVFLTGLRSLSFDTPGAGAGIGVWPTVEQWLMMKGLFWKFPWATRIFFFLWNILVSQ